MKRDPCVGCKGQSQSGSTFDKAKPMDLQWKGKKTKRRRGKDSTQVGVFALVSSLGFNISTGGKKAEKRGKRGVTKFQAS